MRLRYWRLLVEPFHYPFKGLVKGLSIIGVMASSASVERIFSIAGKVLLSDRCQLTDISDNNFS